jgi:competence protein ComFC
MSFLDLLFPKRCIGCGRIGTYFCTICIQTIRPILQSETICPVCEKPAIAGMTHPRCRTKYTIDGLTSFFHYRGIVRQAIKDLKYRFVFDLASEFINLIRPQSLLTIQQYNHVPMIPIPLHPARYRWRGFNQAEKMGTVFCERLAIPMQTDILRRTRQTVPQVAMKDKKHRIANTQGVFQINNDSKIVNRTSQIGILLFDDVFTTGATLREAAQVLKHNGYRYVWGVTMAR